MFKRKYILLLVLFSFALLDTNKFKDYELGRNNDPKTAKDISAISLFTKKAMWEVLSLPGMRRMAGMMFPKNTLTHINTKEKVVAFTIDDGFCGLDNPKGDMTNKVRELFKKYDAKATFFVTGTHCNHTSKSEILKLIEDGHEIANHSMYDTPYNNFSYSEFESDFKKTDNILNQYSENLPKWYRAPHGKFSTTMDKFLTDQGYTHVMCDAFANDTAIPDPKWISEFIVKKTKPGSILLIHMPEKGVREWNYEAMELTLKKITDKGYKIVTFSDLYKLNIN